MARRFNTIEPAKWVVSDHPSTTYSRLMTPARARVTEMTWSTSIAGFGSTVRLIVSILPSDTLSSFDDSACAASVVVTRLSLTKVGRSPNGPTTDVGDPWFRLTALARTGVAADTPI